MTSDSGAERAKETQDDSRGRPPGRSWFLRIYGAGPAHALLLTAGFAFGGYLLTRILGASQPVWILIWFAGAIVLHDLVLLPLYSMLDRVLTSHRGTGKDGVGPTPSWINHVRVPAVISGILLLITFPLVLRLSDHAYARASGLHESVYLARWLFVTVSLFAASALVYGIRWLRARSLLRSDERPDRPDAHTEAP